MPQRCFRSPCGTGRPALRPVRTCRGDVSGHFAAYDGVQPPVAFRTHCSEHMTRLCVTFLVGRSAILHMPNPPVRKRESHRQLLPQVPRTPVVPEPDWCSARLRYEDDRLAGTCEYIGGHARALGGRVWLRFREDDWGPGRLEPAPEPDPAGRRSFLEPGSITAPGKRVGVRDRGTQRVSRNSLITHPPNGPRHPSCSTIFAKCSASNSPSDG